MQYNLKGFAIKLGYGIALTRERRANPLQFHRGIDFVRTVVSKSKMRIMRVK